MGKKERPAKWAEWVSYVRFALADVCVESDCELVSIERFFNRALLMSQVPVALAIFRRSLDGNVR